VSLRQHQSSTVTAPARPAAPDEPDQVRKPLPVRRPPDTDRRATPGYAGYAGIVRRAGLFRHGPDRQDRCFAASAGRMVMLLKITVGDAPPETPGNHTP
jgi:hypothetical protein